MTTAQLSWTIEEITAATSGKPNYNIAVAITGISIDSRDTMPGDLFIALPGAVSDGHEFLLAAKESGANAALVTQVDRTIDMLQICVADCLQALRKLALAGRARFQGIKFGITGSVGKTGSKDMLRHALSQFGTCHASKRSFNNHIGVPITLASLPESADFAVQEIGMNAAGEIADLTRLTRPQIAFITRVADTHSEFFTSTADIAAAKAEIFQGFEGDSVAILNRDDAFFESLQISALEAGAKKVISFGSHSDADYKLLSIDHHGSGMTVSTSLVGLSYTFELQMHGSHFAENAMGVLACVAAAGLPVEKAADALANCLPTIGRGKRFSGIYQDCKIRVIDDSYNASPASMAAALISLISTPPQIMILSDMLELGEKTAVAHAALVPKINKLAPRVVIAIGSAMHDILNELNHAITSYAATDISNALSHLNKSVRNGDLIFIKGSNSSGAWRVRDALCSMITSNAGPNTFGGADHVA